MKLVLATRNKGKIAEIKKLVSDLSQVELVSLDDFQNLPDIAETGKTFKENALIKAKEIASFTGHWALADDSGLVVDYLQGAPGVYSARFSGEKATDEQNNAKLLALLKDVPWEKRQAKFVCVIAICNPKGQCYTLEGECKGYIALEPKGTYGFGYDPVFFVPAYGKTMAELEPEIKNQISHRAMALKQLKPLLRQMLKKSGDLDIY
ncbi:MAG TPA: XTP/dITP diphosphatase [Candidatus Desulfofervidus auxilii]|uniref:dITP/XTP pyrophosphatase n=1 Tax=Desulfofervidus auxilii TaxID=1621989 RepID=A0A7C1W129_DESA2|nr:XTP/dITP diphosphatase [Candidatus Desulfofervidus auxilii]